MMCTDCGRDLAAYAWPDELDRVRVTYDLDQIRYYGNDPDLPARPWQVDAYDSRTKHDRARFAHAVSEDVWNFETWTEAMASIPSFIAHQHGTRPRARFPQAEAEATVCEHGNRVWFGHECGACA